MIFWSRLVSTSVNHRSCVCACRSYDLDLRPFFKAEYMMEQDSTQLLECPRPSLGCLGCRAVVPPVQATENATLHPGRGQATGDVTKMSHG